MVGDLARFGQHRRDQQILGARIGSTLRDIERLLAQAGGSHGQGGFADAGWTNEAGGQRTIGGIDHQPAGQQLAKDFILADPAQVGAVRSRQLKLHPFDFD